MRIYVRKPSTVVAVQFKGKLIDRVYQDPDDKTFYVITIQNQRVKVEPGEWIVEEEGTADRAYPIADEVFKKIYTEVKTIREENSYPPGRIERRLEYEYRGGSIVVISNEMNIPGPPPSKPKGFFGDIG